MMYKYIDQSNTTTGGVAGAFTGGFRQSGHLLVTRYRAGKATVSVASQQVHTTTTMYCCCILLYATLLPLASTTTAAVYALLRNA
jgi:hypothetical protein